MAKFNLAISLNLLLPNLLIISLITLSISLLAPLGILIPISFSILLSSFKNTYLLILLQATARFLSSALVIKVISFWTNILSFKY